jgi:hypothetical protein
MFLVPAESARPQWKRNLAKQGLQRKWIEQANHGINQRYKDIKL